MVIDEGSIDLSSVDTVRFEEAKELYRMIQKMEKRVEPGSKWYIVSMEWIEKWQRHVYFDYLT